MLVLVLFDEMICCLFDIVWLECFSLDVSG